MNAKRSIAIAAFALLSHGAADAADLPQSPEQAALHVLNRLAYGPRPGDIERVTQMGVQRYIDSQLHPESIPMPAALTARLDALETARQPAGRTLAQFLAVREMVKDEGEDAKARRRAVVVNITEQTAEARLARAVDSPRQLEEVMVDFWFNHFNVFEGKGLDRALVASYERDAIRPYALGSFRDLLGATAHHPAMLFYLDNWLSTADGFVPRGRANDKVKAAGLNENYARELMELHTLGVDGGYTQRDVRELARVLTGWTFNPRALAQRNEGFEFNPRRHDKGDKQWLGRTVHGGGQDEGEYALDVLAMHPATAHHLSYQLAQYFVQDAPPPALVERMAHSYLDSKGDIRTVLATLFASPEFMASEAQGAKFKTPYQFVVSAVRAGSAPLTEIKPVLGALNRLGMPLYGCQTPDGYKNTEAAWLNPDALSRRIAYATGMARALDAGALQATLGGAVSARTRDAVAASPEPLRAAMLLGGPDFMQH
ncbi:DUF1800 domain-containing protein [Rugamonas apoptosis]|uniref:DUF1800 domain-containing protein n=1 Tax=Rugamonas apoptosis TaxID=2758570 RepID=A0A7W2F7M6_9BURK|nr:DUF1800 domain-containing protein [Rugamonas apoptosis]MBA5686636.1 DUF1800 domain-containing protein [Rugamonas apoptosis]